MLTAPELLTLIKAHNILSKIKVPAKARKDAGALEKLINEANYKVDHDKKLIKPTVKRGKSITLKSAEELTKPKVAPEVSKAKREAKKAEKEVEKKKELKLAKKEAVQEFKTKQKEGKKKAPRLKALKKISVDNKKEGMGETAFIKKQKQLQLKKQKETRQALLKQKVKVDKTTRRGKPVKKEEPVKKDNKYTDNPNFTMDNPDTDYQIVKYDNVNEEITDLLYGARVQGGQYTKGGKVETELFKVKPEDLIKVKGALKTRLKKDLDNLDGQVGLSIGGVSGEVEYTDNMKKLREELLKLKSWTKYYPQEEKTGGATGKEDNVLDSNSFKASNLNAKDLVKLIDSLGLDYRFNRGRLMIGTYRDFLEGVVSGGDFNTSTLKPVITIEEREKLPKHIRLLYSYRNNDNEYKLLNKTSKKELVMKIKKFFNK
mgnify:CR=1 FL=1|tara:strand:+ start:1861 stop:3150 length:1290 start_codon:yes stop_codon:yes gene_type:complete